MNEYKKKNEEILKEQNVDISVGLSTEEVNARHEQYGLNELREKKKTTLLQMFLSQFNDFLVIILLFMLLCFIIVLILLGQKL
mgnify:CR=1 FL=1